jgi:hypothetical protein
MYLHAKCRNTCVSFWRKADELRRLPFVRFGRKPDMIGRRSAKQVARSRLSGASTDFQTFLPLLLGGKSLGQKSDEGLDLR